ncbi:hypothetical protein P154DRAFT_582360 [Amniculicola lignicola CBS 123094]|uniref:Uncharacterized protein n=1 Tax=Amniculicola lignicola CBS 123094 TaxID=1392246 RepID=A0A6A5VWV4_9PLEO|nr:hypothetical protein P154DRAFT_582360 [Amniculicola lignicola CBS 123094]
MVYFGCGRQGCAGTILEALPQLGDDPYMDRWRARLAGATSNGHACSTLVSALEAPWRHPGSTLEAAPSVCIGGSAKQRVAGPDGEQPAKALSTLEDAANPRPCSVVSCSHHRNVPRSLRISCADLATRRFGVSQTPGFEQLRGGGGSEALTTVVDGVTH